MKNKEAPSDVGLITAAIREFLRQTAPNGRAIGTAKCGVYAFFDYDGEPIYVGQTVETLNTRIGRHLTGRRSDAVAKYVLDPYEVLEIEVWPLWEAEKLAKPDKKKAVDASEFLVYRQSLDASAFHAVLNEADIAQQETIPLPISYRGRIVPDSLYSERSHPDIRLARRTQTVANLARLISERKIEKGLRRVLLTQSKRLLFLAEKRYDDFSDESIAIEANMNDQF